MSVFIPTSTVSIYRGLDVDAYGDEVDSSIVFGTSPFMLKVPVSIAEQPQRSFLPVEDRGGVVDKFVIRFRPNVQVEEQDRLLDEQTGAVYQVRTVKNLRHAIGMSDVIVEAVQVASQSQPVNG